MIVNYITKKRLIYSCDFCEKEFELWNNDLKENNFCSRKCSASRKSFKEKVKQTGLSNKGKVFDKEQFKQRNLIRGENHHWYKNGETFRNKKGYYKKFKIKYVLCPEEYKSMSRKDGYVMEHRLVMAISLNRCLTRTEVVHHIDHNPENNELSNLMLFKNNKEHKEYEHKHKRIRN